MALSESVSSVIQIARNVTGRVDQNDPAYTDTIMLQFLNNFIQTSNTTEVRLFQQKTWLEFDIDETTANPYPIVLDSLYLTTIEPPIYVGGFEAFWYQDPALFYGIWPETQTYTPQRPTYVLYYNNELTFRGPPDTQYRVKIKAYKVDVALDGTSNISNAYLYRYLAYGMALDIFADAGELDQYNQYFPIYNRYKGQVLSRTHAQYMNQRSTPTF